MRSRAKNQEASLGRPWRTGDRLSHRYNRELGPGLVLSAESRRLVVLFPQAGETLQFSADSEALQPLILQRGSSARLEPTGEQVVVADIDGVVCTLDDGRQVAVTDLWPLPPEETLVERLVRGRIDPWEDFRNRLDGLRMLRLRRADGLGSFLGGRVRLFPHQLHVAERATAAYFEHGRPVRFLLADEVGLGKTVEACLIMNRLLHGTGAGKGGAQAERGPKPVERTLVVAPETLTVQWLGELWRKHHMVFALLDDARLQDVARDHGSDFNPFEIYRRAIVSIERLAANRRLVEQAAEAGVDLLVVDEAHHLRRPSGHPGNPAYRAIAPLADLGRHVLLLTATPLEDDAHGFFRLLQLLRPDELPLGELDLERRLADARPLPPCTSATRRVDIGGLPPRIGRPIALAAGAWQPFATVIEALRQGPADNALQRQRKAELLTRALASSAALAAALPDEPALRAGFEAMSRTELDPRVAWLLEQAPRWRREREKTLIFVAHKESLDALKRELERRVQVGIFHEGLSAERRDIEVAQFRLAEGPALLIATECGGEGRNFEFCTRLVLFDLPWNPATVEQRIGRLDRIGRRLPTEIVYFKPPTGLGRLLAELYEEIGLFAEPIGGLVLELRHLAREIERVALDGGLELGAAGGLEHFAGVLAESRAARDRVQQAAYHQLHSDPYRAELGPAILARVPVELDALTEEVVTHAAARFGFGLETLPGERAWMVTYGGDALIDHLPGVMPGTVFRGSFDREAAVADETLDYFAAGHALVEGVLAELEEGPRGKVAMVQVAGEREDFGLIAVLPAAGAGKGAARDGSAQDVGYELVAVDAAGRPRPDLAAHFTTRSFESEPVEIKQWTSQPSWSKSIQRMAEHLPADRPPLALAAVRIRRGR